MTPPATRQRFPNIWNAPAVSEGDVSLSLLGNGCRIPDWCSSAERVAARRWIEELHKRNSPRIADLLALSNNTRAGSALTIAHGPFAPLASLFPVVKAYADGWPVLSVGPSTIFGQRVSDDGRLLQAVQAAPAGGYLYIGCWPPDADAVTVDGINDAVSAVMNQRADLRIAMVDNEAAYTLRHLASRTVCAERVPANPPRPDDLARFMADPTGCRTRPMDPRGFRWSYCVSYPQDPNASVQPAALAPDAIRLSALLLAPPLSP